MGVNAQVTLKNSWNMPDHEGQAGFKALKEKGTRIISIDPVYNETAKLAGPSGLRRTPTPTWP